MSEHKYKDAYNKGFEDGRITSVNHITNMIADEWGECIDYDKAGVDDLGFRSALDCIDRYKELILGRK